MNNQEQQLEAILRSRGLAWAIDMFAPSSQAAAHHLELLARLEQDIKDRGLGTSSFSPDSLQQLLSVSPYKADAFLQSLVSIRSPSILCAAWRILQGMEIECVEMRYDRLSEFALRIVLRSPDSEPDNETETYESNNIDDVVFIRHLGKSTVDGKPFFNGFYALRQT